MASSTTLSVKVSSDFAKRYREFCEANCLQVGRFTEHVLTEMMEDYHFGKKAQRVLAESTGKRVNHAEVRKKAR